MARGAVVYLQLRPGLRRVWRGPGTVQIGLSRQGTVVDGLTDDDAALLDLLASGLDAADLTSGRIPSSADRARELVRLLAEARVLVGTRSGRGALARLAPARERLAPDAAVWALAHPGHGDGWDTLAARAARQVLIRGGGRTAFAIACSLAAAGVRVRLDAEGTVSAGDLGVAGPSPQDVGRPVRDAIAELVRRVATLPSAEPPTGPWDLVVLVDPAVADSCAAGPLVAAEIPHLSVVVREADVVVGPLVRPGHGPCLRCLDLHRSDRDPGWPRVLAQLVPPAGGGPGPEETVLSQLAASVATLQALALLDAKTVPASVGATLEIELPDGLISRRPWPAHPGCGCHWPPSGRVENTTSTMGR
ncbi:MAG: thiamine biosynthesis protein ThiF [Actinomycetales bacterium]|nr:thiamine biosynthesis protein ThiF [Actinomycetales bacterium]